MDYQYYMQKALDLAAKGWPHVAPNPMVGCVIVKKDQIVASGYHQSYGAPHAEVNAVKNLPDTVRADECVVFVTLEPCNHQGKTPPCTELLIRAGFKTVVIACKDPNPLVSGSGIGRLLAAGLEVVPSVLENEARELNRRFITFYELKRPYITLKWAITAEGFTARDPQPETRSENIITRDPAQKLAHRLRAEHMGILVGKNTVLVDNPSLTARLVEGKNPVRIFIDGQLEVPRDFNIYNTEARTLVFNYLKDGEEANITYIRMSEKCDVLETIMAKLYQMNIQSLLVEGGTVLLDSFIGKNLWDEALVFQNPDLHFGRGLKGPLFPLKNTFELVGEDKLYSHRRQEKPGGPPVNETF